MVEIRLCHLRYLRHVLCGSHESCLLYKITRSDLDSLFVDNGISPDQNNELCRCLTVITEEYHLIFLKIRVIDCTIQAFLNQLFGFR